MVAKKSLKNSTINKWNHIFQCDLDCGIFYKNKMKHIMETKLKEFNYKLFSNILVNGVNLYKWKKWRSESCIYCNDVKQDSQHMLHTS